MLENNCFGCRAKHSSKKNARNGGWLSRYQTVDDTVDECFEDAVKGLYFCVDKRTAWVVLSVVNGQWVGIGD